MKLILAIFLSMSLVSCAQKAKRQSSDGFNDDAEMSGSDSKDQMDELDQTNDKRKDKSDFDKNEVSNSDLKALSEAKKSGSEAKLLAAAAQNLSKNPKDLQTLNTLAVHYFRTKRYGMAKLLLKRALADHGKAPSLYNNLGIIQLAEGDMRSALENFRKSISLKSNYEVGATNLGSIYLEHYDYSRSLAPLEESYEDTKSDLRRGRVEAIEIANNYGVALMGVGEKAKAEKVFEKIYDSEVRNPVPILNYAILLVEVLKKKKDAVRVISKLKFISTDPQILRQADLLERKLGSM